MFHYFGDAVQALRSVRLLMANVAASRECVSVIECLTSIREVLVSTAGSDTTHRANLKWSLNVNIATLKQSQGFPSFS